MAMALRDVTYCRLACNSFSKLWCGAEPTSWKSQVVKLLNSDKYAKKGPNLSRFRADFRLGCQPVSRISRKTFEDGISEKEWDRVADMRSMENTRAGLRCSFETSAAVGPVECSSQGCRPILEEQPTEYISISFAEQLHGVKDHRIIGSNVNYYGSRRGRSLSDVKVREPAIDRISTKKSFEAALQSVAPRDPHLLSDFAVFAWRTLGELDRAQELYNEALGVSPDDTDILASYAHFLWQCDQ